MCTTGAVCRIADTGGGTCTATCKPNDPAFWEILRIGEVFESDDCGICMGAAASGSGPDEFNCVSGSLVPTGQVCDLERRICERGNFCYQSAGLHGETLTGVCTPNDCTVTPCPDGVGCYAVTQGAQARHHCIADGTLPLQAECVEDRNCEAGLLCTAGRCSLP